MTKYERLCNRLENREMIIGENWMIINQPLLLSKFNFDTVDFILFDCEHGIYNNEILIPSLQVCRLIDFPSIVRVPIIEYSQIARAVQLGADGVMIPRTETVDQVRCAVEAMRFYPIGKTGIGGHGQFRNDDETIDEYQRSRLLMVQIESPLGIKNLPDMLSQYGDEIACIIIGPNDLSITSGCPLDHTTPIMVEQIQKIFDISKSFGKSVGIFCEDEAAARIYRPMGANVIWLSADSLAFQRGMEEIYNSIEDLR